MDGLDPTTAGSLDALATCLRRLHLQADTPTYRSLDKQTVHANDFLPGTRLKRVRLTRSTLSDMLLGRKLPSKAFLLTFVEACGVQIENDPRWAQAWDRLASPYRDKAGQAETEPLRQQLAEAEARADQAAREADELRRRLNDVPEPEGLYDVPKPEGTRSAAIPFWDVLDPTEREVLRAVASVRTFAAGATIMQQGEPADYVLVILGGRASIRVNDNGNERVLAERGRGQLIGESGALQVSTRSANVVVLEMIWALVVQTRDFAAFLSSNPRILDFVQEQSRDRGTYQPDGHHHSDRAGFHATSADGMTMRQPNDAPAGQQQSLRGENCTVVLTDVVGFGGSSRTDTDRGLIRDALFKMIQEATQDLQDVRSEDRGDGILIVIPPNVPTAEAIDQLLRALPRALDQHNSSQRNRNSARFQLRLSASVGPVASDKMGVSGEAIIVAARLVEAPAFKEAFVGSTARLGIIVSQFVYDTVIRHSPDLDYVASYFEIRVEVKELSTTAWMKLIG
jgi:CRP-like cAMP-binding protein